MVYGYGHWYRSVTLTAAGAAVLAYLAVTVALFVSGDTCRGVVFAVSAVPAAGLLAYWGVWRRPYRLELSGDAILWYTPLGRGRMPVKLLYSIERGAYLRPGADPYRGDVPPVQRSDPLACPARQPRAVHPVPAGDRASH